MGNETLLYNHLITLLEQRLSQTWTFGVHSKDVAVEMRYAVLRSL